MAKKKPPVGENVARNYPHLLSLAAANAESRGNRSQHSDDEVDNSFQSFLFHDTKKLEVKQ